MVTVSTLARSLLANTVVKPRQGYSDVFRSARRAMVKDQLRHRGISDERVLRAMSQVPRHLFVPDVFQRVAYEDGPLPIGHRQTISQPYMVARMVEALKLTGEERALDVGTGSGYQAAVLAKVAREVWSVEIVPELAESARERLARLGYSNVHVIVGNGSIGLPSHAPYSAIVVAAGSPDVPTALVDQLEPEGRLVIPVGPVGYQVLQRITKREGGLSTESLLPCVFVPLLGEKGWTVRETSLEELEQR